MLNKVASRLTSTLCRVGFCGGSEDASQMLWRRMGSVPLVPALAARKVIDVHANAGRVS